MLARRTSLSTWLTDAPVLAVAVVWGPSYLATKAVTGQATVIAVLLLRFLIAVPLLGVVVLGRVRSLRPSELRGGVVLGVILTTVFLLETYGVVHTSATNAGLIISLTMIFTPLAETALHRVAPRPAFLCAGALSVGGVALLTQGQGFTSEDEAHPAPLGEASLQAGSDRR